MKSVMLLLFVIVPLVFAQRKYEWNCWRMCGQTDCLYVDTEPFELDPENEYSVLCKKCHDSCRKNPYRPPQRLHADQPWPNKQKRSEKCENRCLVIQPCKAPSNEDDYNKCEACFKKCDKSKRDDIHILHSPVSGGIAPMTNECELKCTHSTECATQPSGKKCNECYNKCDYKGNINDNLAYDQPIE